MAEMISLAVRRSRVLASTSLSRRVEATVVTASKLEVASRAPR
jgi:hypothetical protein